MGVTMGRMRGSGGGGYVRKYSMYMAQLEPIQGFTGWMRFRFCAAALGGGGEIVWVQSS